MIRHKPHTHAPPSAATRSSSNSTSRPPIPSSTRKPTPSGAGDPRIFEDVKAWFGAPSCRSTLIANSTTTTNETANTVKTTTTIQAAVETKTTEFKDSALSTSPASAPIVNRQALPLTSSASSPSLAALSTYATGLPTRTPGVFIPLACADSALAEQTFTITVKEVEGATRERDEQLITFSAQETNEVSAPNVATEPTAPTEPTEPTEPNEVNELNVTTEPKEVSHLNEVTDPIVPLRLAEISEPDEVSAPNQDSEPDGVKEPNVASETKEVSASSQTNEVNEPNEPTEPTQVGVVNEPNVTREPNAVSAPIHPISAPIQPLHTTMCVTPYRSNQSLPPSNPPPNLLYNDSHSSGTVSSKPTQSYRCNVHALSGLDKHAQRNTPIPSSMRRAHTSTRMYNKVEENYALNPHGLPNPPTLPTTPPASMPAPSPSASLPSSAVDTARLASAIATALATGIAKIRVILEAMGMVLVYDLVFGTDICPPLIDGVVQLGALALSLGASGLALLAGILDYISVLGHYALAVIEYIWPSVAIAIVLFLSLMVSRSLLACPERPSRWRLPGAHKLPRAVRMVAAIAIPAGAFSLVTDLVPTCSFLCYSALATIPTLYLLHLTWPDIKAVATHLRPHWRRYVLYLIGAIATCGVVLGLVTLAPYVCEVLVKTWKYIPMTCQRASANLARMWNVVAELAGRATANLARSWMAIAELPRRAKLAFDKWRFCRDLSSLHAHHKRVCEAATKDGAALLGHEYEVTTFTKSCPVFEDVVGDVEELCLR